MFIHVHLWFLSLLFYWNREGTSCRVSDWERTMTSKLRSIGLRYGLPLASFVLIIWLVVAINRWFSLPLDADTFIIALLIATAWYGGRGPGLLIAIVFEATIDYFHFQAQPLTGRYAFIILNRTALFVTLALFASSRRKAERERDELLRREKAARNE